MRPLNVLVVEDEMLVAMDIEAMLMDAGHNIVGGAANLLEFEALADLVKPDLALVDLNLAQGSHGLDVSSLIQRRWRSTVIVFLTANPKKIPDDFAGAHGVIAKPFSRAGLMSALQFLSEGICDPPPSVAQPQSFVAAPGFVQGLRA